ncbi:MAG TPA: UbiC family transcriptional regulator [Micromonosporaceae bacterium]|nr:UbiC family transcriptional regulator [Micromonosporaceae bacterium]HCU50066.1 UbiC family transcriptional regulator [Micromonosporaceae bacterium]
MTSSDKWVSISAEYVLPRPPGASDAWQEETGRQGRTGSQTLQEVSEVEPPAEVAQGLGLAPGDLAVVRRRLVLLDQQPVELAESYYPLTIARGTALADFRKIRGGAVTLLSEMGHRPKRVIEDVFTRMPSAEERELLELADDQPVLVLVRQVIGNDDLPIEVSVMTIADGRRLRYELTV